MNWPALRRLLVILVFALWWGGFTFYAVAVVPTGHRVLGSKVRQGFITQRVTDKLNALAAITLAMLALEGWLARRAAGARRLRRAGMIAWVVMGLSLATLHGLHGVLDALLDPVARVVRDDDRFYSVHRAYLLVATLQWLASLVVWGWLLSSARGSNANGEAVIQRPS